MTTKREQNWYLITAEFLVWAEKRAAAIREGKKKRFHAVFCDPPYDLAFMGKSWDVGAEYKEWGKALLPLLYPGALVFMFGGTRTWHRLASGMEDAGFQMWDTLMWLHGQGFPKGQDISKLIDKVEKGHPQGSTQGDPDSPNSGKFKTQRTEGKRSSTDKGQHFGAGPGQFMREAGERYERDLVDIAKPWSGHKTCALKPAWEPVLCFRAPSEGKNYAELALKYGSGALNVAGVRIGTSKTVPTNVSRASGRVLNGSLDGSLRRETGKEDGHNPNIGRYPANLVLDEEAGAMLDAQSGISKSTGGQASLGAFRTGKIYGKGLDRRTKMDPGLGDTGGASRFFYCAKASRSERELGLRSKPETGGGHRVVRNNHPT